MAAKSPATVFFEVAEDPAEPDPVVSMQSAAALSEAIMAAFPSTRPIDQNGAAADSESSEDEGATALIDPDFVAFADADDASEAGIKIGEDDVDASAGRRRFVLQFEQGSVGARSRIAVGLLHPRPSPQALHGVNCATESTASLLGDGMVVATLNTTRKAGGKNPADFAKDMKKRFATGAVVRMVPPQIRVGEAVDRIIEAAPLCSEVESLRKKHYMSVYMSDASSFELEDVGEEGA